MFQSKVYFSCMVDPDLYLHNSVKVNRFIFIVFEKGNKLLPTSPAGTPIQRLSTARCRPSFLVLYTCNVILNYGLTNQGN